MPFWASHLAPFLSAISWRHFLASFLAPFLTPFLSPFLTPFLASFLAYWWSKYAALVRTNKRGNFALTCQRKVSFEDFWGENEWFHVNLVTNISLSKFVDSSLIVHNNLIRDFAVITCMQKSHKMFYWWCLQTPVFEDNLN